MRETTRHRRAFDVYVQLGPRRSLQQLRSRLLQDPLLIGLSRAPSLSTLEAWSSALHWQARLDDLEREAQARDREAQIKALQDMKRRQLDSAELLQNKGRERPMSLGVDEMLPADAIRAISEGIRLERLARGEPTERILEEGLHLHGLANFSNEELRRLAELAERRSFGDGEA